MSKTITITITDAQAKALETWELETAHITNHGRDEDTLFVYTVEDIQVTLWVIEPSGETHQEILEYDGWNTYTFDEASEEWVELEEDEDE